MEKGSVSKGPDGGFLIIDSRINFPVKNVVIPAVGKQRFHLPRTFETGGLANVAGFTSLIRLKSQFGCLPSHLIYPRAAPSCTNKLVVLLYERFSGFVTKF